MTDDAVRNGAITREIGEELLLVQGRQWIVNICSERLEPEGFKNLRGFDCRSKEGRKKAELFLNLRFDLSTRACALKRFIACRLRGIQPRFRLFVIPFFHPR